MGLGFVETLLRIHNYTNSVPKIKSTLIKTTNPIRLGILSAASINNIAIFDPVSTHPDIIITGIAARSKLKAEAQIRQYFGDNNSNNNNNTKKEEENIKIYESYDDLLNDSQIEAVYIPLPNGLHAEWAIKAMKKGKHVLIEKPVASNAEEVQKINEVRRETGVVVLEAFHWRFHPSAHEVKDLVSGGGGGGGGYGDVVGVDAVFKLSAGTVEDGDIRFNYDLAGGASMDLAYVFSAACYFAGVGSDGKADVEVLEAIPRKYRGDDRVDEAIRATFEIRPGGGGGGGGGDETGSTKPPVRCTVYGDLAMPKMFGVVPKMWDITPVVKIECERARVEFENFVAPWLTHSITVTPKDTNGKLLTSKRFKKKSYTGGKQWGDGYGKEWWTSYRYQLEAFVNRVRAVQSGQSTEKVDGPWVSLEESETVMKVIDGVYDKAGMPRRGM